MMPINFLDERLPMHFWDRVIPEPNSGCWLWLGYLNGSGYGQVNRRTAHRWTYLEIVGPIPAGLQLDHLCRTRNCVNPAHLEPVTNRENSLRRTRLITHCKQGHPFDAENTLINNRSNGKSQRMCAACARERKQNLINLGLCRNGANHGRALPGNQICQACRDVRDSRRERNAARNPERAA